MTARISFAYVRKFKITGSLWKMSKWFVKISKIANDESHGDVSSP